jgi:DNA-binding SARP family transcriptional activator
LTVRANEVVSAAALIDGLWGEDPPATAGKTLQAHVARLRRALEAAGLAGAIETREPGYRLTVPGGAVDAARFEHHLRDGRRAIAAGRYDDGERELAAGLALWRGDALADCRTSGALEAAAVGLEERRLAAIEDRVDAELALGRHATVVGELESLLVRFPLRERLWGALMTALYRSQRQGDAIRAYQRARDTLVETLGVEPGPELRRLEQAVLAGDPILDAPVSAPSAAVAEPTSAGSPERLTASATSGPALVGRRSELGRLEALWTDALAGGRPIALVGGEPGIGKTRLAAEIALEAHADGAHVLYGRCDEGLGVPYQPFVEALRAWIAVCPDRALVESLGSYPGELSRLVPELGSRWVDLPPPLLADPATQQYRLFDAVVEWLAASARQAPVVVVLDDLHWAAPPTVLLLRHVLRSSRIHRLLLVVTYRQSELHPEHPFRELLADVHVTARVPHVHHFELTGLDPMAVAQVVETAAGHDLDEAGQAFARTLHAETAGNPFFVNEIVQSLVEAGRLGAEETEGGERSLSEVRIPPAARDVVLRRVSRLSDTAQQVLGVAAVVGVEFDASVLEELLLLDDDLLFEALEEAVAARLVGEAGRDRFFFAHALVRAALYDGLSESRRARLHRRVGEAIERVYAGALVDHLGELADHFAPSEPAKAVRYTLDAADAALRGLAFDDAVNLCRRGLTVVELAEADGTPIDLADQCDLLLLLGRAEFRAGHPSSRATLLRAFATARELDDPDRLAAVVLTANRGFFARMGRTDTDLVAALRETIAHQPSDETAVLAELLAVLASELEWAPDGDDRFELSDRALTMARRVGDEATLARVMLLRTMTIAAPDTLAERIANCEELLAVAERLGDPGISFQAAWARSPTAVESGDVRGVDGMVELASQLASDLRQPLLQWQASFMQAARLILRGELAEAEALAFETRRLGRRASQTAEAEIFYNEQMLEIRRWQDRVAEVVLPFRDLAGNEEIDFGYALTRYLYDAGEHDLAAERYDSIMQRVEIPPRRDLLAAPLLCNLAYLAARLGDVPRARLLHREIMPIADSFANTTVAKPVGHHFLGMLAATLGDDAAADRAFTAALEAHERACTPLLCAETLVEHARLCARRHDRATFEQLVGRARSIAVERGAAFVVRECDEIAASVG